MSCSIPVSGPVWSVSWSPHNSHQLLLGLDKGRIAVADIRKSSSQALMLTSNASSSCRPFQPLHSVIPLAPCQVQQLCSSGGGAAVWDNGSAPEAVVACAGEQYVQRVQYNPTQANCKQRLIHVLPVLPQANREVCDIIIAVPASLDSVTQVPATCGFCMQQLRPARVAVVICGICVFSQVVCTAGVGPGRIVLTCSCPAVAMEATARALLWQQMEHHWQYPSGPLLVGPQQQCLQLAVASH